MSQFENNAVDPLFQQKFSHLQKRILSLEISLQEASKGGIISPDEGKRRASQIRYLQSCMDQISLLVHNQKKGGEEHDTGLPDLSRCTYQELVIINRIHNDRLRFIKDVYHYLGKIFQWTISASRGHGSGILAIFRLSRMKNILQRLQHENTKMDLEDKSLSDTTAHLCRILLNRPEGERLHENFQSYMKLFQELDGMALRIHKMKSTVARETRELTSIQEDIKKLEKNADVHRPTLPPPLKHLEQLAQSARTKTYQPVHGEKDKLTLARQFIEAREKTRQNEKR